MGKDEEKPVAMEEDDGNFGAEKPQRVRSEGDTITDVESEFTPEEQRHIMRRLDRRLITTVGFMYCISLIDRTNLGAANIAGMGVELEMSGPVNGIRYVSEIFKTSSVCWVLLSPVTNHHAVVYRDAGLFRHIRPFPTSFNDYCSKNRAPDPLVHDHIVLGCSNAVYGLC